MTKQTADLLMLGLLFAPFVGWGLGYFVLLMINKVKDERYWRAEERKQKGLPVHVRCSCNECSLWRKRNFGHGP